MRNTLLLIDGYSQIYRAFYAIPQLSTSKGQPTNAIYGFLKSLRKILAQLDPSHAAVVMDEGEPEARLKQLPTYKATRKPMPEPLRPQIPLIKQLVPLCGLHLLEIAGVEADDIIATLADKAVQQKLPVVIATSDKDFMQLVGPLVEVLDPSRLDQRFDTDAVRRRYGVEPSQIVELLSLVGDASDNVPGVPGIGPKTAQVLLKKYGSIEELLRRLDELDKPRLAEALRANTAQIRFNLSFMALDHNVPLPWSLDSLRRKPPDYGPLCTMLRDLEFTSLEREISEESRKVSDPELDFGEA